MSLTAYIRYDSTGRLVPGGPIVVADKPAVGNWQTVTEGTNVTLSGKLRAFVKLDRYNKPIAGTLFFGKKQPATGKWLEVNATYALSVTPSTTTTSTTTEFVGFALPIYQGKNAGVACAGGTPSTRYINTPVFYEGITVYNNSQCTVTMSAVGAMVLQNDPVNVYSVNSSGVTALVGQCTPLTTTTTTATPVYTITGYANWNSGAEACVAYGAGLLVYSSTPQQSVGNGTRLYIDQELTTPLEVAYVSINGNSYSNTNGLLSNQQPCPPPVYTVGQNALGGTIAYILQPGDPGYDVNVQHGFVATVNDTSGGSPWGCDGSSISNANGTAIGTGVTNTNSIVSQCGENGAAMICFNLIEGGYSDWYLPSNDELTKLDQNKTAIGGFTNDWYWSSTEESSLNAYSYLFGSSFLTSSAKWAPYRVRAIRSF